MQLTHLQRLEAESIHIFREVVAEAEKPVMLYSVGKDSAVMLHLARKAFHPVAAAVPAAARRHDLEVPRHVRDARPHGARSPACELIVYSIPEAKARGINPFDHGSAVHTDMWKTEGLKQALDKYGFDVAFGGARRDEEKSRAKERIFSFRSANHRWDPKQPAPGAVAALQRQEAARREHPRVPALELDRARRLAVHPPAEHSDRAAVFRQRRGPRSNATACSSWSTTIAFR